MMTLSGLISLVKKQVVYLPLGLLLALPAHAVFIDFDDLEYVPSHPVFDFFADHPLTDEYLDRGLLIEGGFLASWGNSNPESIISAPNYLLGGNWLSLIFVGDVLPVYVSMYVTAGNGDAGYLEAHGADGWVELQQTPGEAGPQTRPFQEKNFISFYHSPGIQSITMWSYWGSRVSLIVDDLTYEYAVPGPSPLVLLGIGLLALILRIQRHQV